MLLTALVVNNADNMRTLLLIVMAVNLIMGFGIDIDNGIDHVNNY